MPLRPLLDAPSLSEQAYEAIKAAILSLDIRPGEVLGIGSLAEQLGVSRTPVRDALLLLEKDGLVTLLPQKGAYVSEISVGDIEEIYELRILLEGYAARVAAMRLKAYDLKHIEASLQDAEEAFQRGDRVLTADVGRRVHDLLVETVGNERLKTFLGELDTHYTRIRRFAVHIPGRFEKSHQEHMEILAALHSRDTERAERAMMAHLTSVRDDTLSYIGTLATNLESREEPIPIPVMLSSNGSD